MEPTEKHLTENATDVTPIVKNVMDQKIITVTLADQETSSPQEHVPIFVPTVNIQTKPSENVSNVTKLVLTVGDQMPMTAPCVNLQDFYKEAFVS